MITFARIIFIVVFMSIIGTTYGQKNLPEYKASNGITYQPGDTVRLGMGSGTNGEFLYVASGGLAPAGLSRAYAQRYTIIKKINNVKFKGQDSYYFVVSMGNSIYNLGIENAIASCEVACK